MQIPGKRSAILLFKALVFYIAIFFNFSIILHSQEFNVKFQHLTIEDGLSQSSIYCALQDKRGFMWFGTEDGLNKYDGSSFRVYKNDAEDARSLSYNYVKAICRDCSEGLWIGTYGGGLNRFDQERDHFIRYKNNPAEPNSLSNNFINSICEDQRGYLWIGTEYGLNKFNKKNESFVQYKNNPRNPFSLSSNKVTFVYEDKSGVLWVGTEGGGLNKLDLDREKEKFICYKNDPHDPHSLRNNNVRCIYEDRVGVLWIGTENGLSKFDRQKEKFTHYRHNANNPNSLSHNIVTVILEDRSGELWIGTEGGGLDKLDRIKGHFVHYTNEPFDPSCLSNNEIYSLYEDRSNVLWIGTHVGLNKLDQEKKQFNHYVLSRFIRPGAPGSLSYNDVRAIYRDRSGMLWIGSYEGLIKFDRDKKRCVLYRNDPDNTSTLSNNRVMSIHEDSSGIFWIGTYGGLDRFNLDKEQFSHYTFDPNDTHSLSSNLVRVVYEDESGMLWIGTEDGLNRFDRNKEQFARYKNDPDDPQSLSNDFIYSIYEDNSGVLWIGTLDGLNKFDQKKERFTHYRHNPDNPDSLGNSEILSIYEDSSGVLWIGTPGGLNKFDRDKETFTHYTERNGLPNELIYDILEDNKRNLWLTTNKGLSRFNPRTEEFKNYDVKDGLQSNEFSTGACYEGEEGELFIGGINGFNSFYPEKIKDNPHIPLVAITDFQISNKPVLIGKETDEHSILTKSITETQEIKLSYKDRILTFEFAALHYASPGKNQYAYMMERFEEKWNYVGNRRFATYTNLPPGDYIFRVKASNNDGLWNEEGVSLRITVVPPFWQAWWFQGLCGLSILLLIFSIYKRRTHTIRERALQLKEQIERRTGELQTANKELQQEIIERKRAEEALQTEKAYLDQLFESAQEAIVMTDNNSRVMRINDEFTRLFGYKEEEAIGKPIDDMISSGDLTKEAAFYTHQLIAGKKIAFESVRQQKDGKLINVSVIGSPIVVGNKQVASYAIYRDITQRQKAEQDIKRRAAQAALIYKVGQRVSSELELQPLLSEIVVAVQETFSYYGVMLLLLDEEGKFLNLQAIQGGYVDIFPQDLRAKVGEGMIGYAASSGITQVSSDVSKDPYYVRLGDEKTKSELSVPVKSGDKVIGVLDIQSDECNAFGETDVAAMETLSTQIATAIENAHLYENAQREITERKRVEKKLSGSLKEKEVLLKEIHHRVKNNMQIISSLLRLQSYSIKDEKMQEIFEVSQNRIRSMALIHEKLYQSKDLARIDFADYTRSLIDNLFSIYRVDINTLNARLDLEKIYIDINTAIPLGLIINELVSNSLKHAFPDGKTWAERDKSKGEISLNLHSDNGREITLTVADNGVGLSEDFDFRKSQSLGLQLVSDLVDQLDGSIEIRSKRGTVFRIKFPFSK